MNTTRKTLTLSSKKKHLVVSETEFSPAGFAVSSKRGIAEIAEGMNPEEVLAAAQEGYEWELQGEPDRQGFYRAVAKEAEA